MGVLEHGDKTKWVAAAVQKKTIKKSL